MEELLSDLGGGGLISPEDKDRSKALHLLIDRVLGDKFASNSYPIVVEFLCNRLTDSPCLIDVLSCFKRFLSKAKISEDLVMQFLKRLDESILLSEQSQAIRHAGLLLFSEILLHIKDSPASVDMLFHVFLAHCFGERDPRNLMLLFRLSCDLIRNSNSQKFKEELFESIFCYFPISFTPPPDDPFGITPDNLSAELEAVLMACFSNSLSSLVLEALIERLEEGNNASHGILVALSHLLSGAENWGLVSSDSSLVARLVDILIKCLKLNSKEATILIFLSVPCLLLEAKKALSLLAHSILLDSNGDSAVTDNDNLVPALFELDAIDDKILDQIIIDPFSSRFLSFLSCISDRLPTDALKSFSKRLDNHLEFTGNLQDLPFISLAVQVLQRLECHFHDSEKISSIQKAAFEALIRQVGNSKATLQTLIETRLLAKLSPSLYSSLLSIQSFLPSDEAKDPIIKELGSLKEELTFCGSGCCSENPAPPCGKVRPIPQSHDTSEWLNFLSLEISPLDDELLSKVIRHPCVWVRLALIQRITNHGHIDDLLSDSKRVVRKAAAVRKIFLTCNTTCCKS